MAGHSRTVVVAVNPSEPSQHALEWYKNNLYRKEDHVILFYCQAPYEEPADPYTRQTLDCKKKERKHEESRNEFIEVYKEKCKTYSLSATIKVESHHRPGEHICHFAKEANAAYIVVGKRGLGAIRRTLIGGVSDHVVAHANMPVVIVPAKH